MNIKTKVAAGVVVLALGALVVLSATGAHADTALSVSCSGTPSGNASTGTIAWSETASGGNAPYMILWTGDTSINNATSAAVTGTYAANGTYTASVQVTDASSSVATSTCSATVSSIVTPVATSTVNVLVSVNNTAGGSSIPSNFTVSVSGAGAVPSSFAGSSAGTAVIVNSGSAFSVSASSLANYNASMGGTCSGTLATGDNESCTITETYVPPSVTTSTPPVTPPHPFVNPPTLQIGANGNFLARGMTVTSVGTNSFQAQVWGITYTVNWSGNLNTLEFWFRYNRANGSSTPSTQLQVGDEVGVSGTVSSSSPMTVNANVVRDYSITAPRPGRYVGFGQGGFNLFGSSTGQQGNGNGGGNGNGNQNHGGGSSTSDFQNRLQNLMQQFQGLQQLFRGRFGGR